MKYIVEITETLQKQIQVEAETESEAIEIAKDVYYQEQEVLMPEDLIETSFEIIERDSNRLGAWKKEK